MKIAVLASGKGTNLQAIIDAAKSGLLGGVEISLVVSDNPKAFALERAKREGIECLAIVPSDFDSREQFDERLRKEFEKREIGLIVLAGFMRVLTAEFVRFYKGRIINIHPALLPAFKGAHAIKDAFDYGVKLTGVTVHFVDEGVDTGPIIAQAPVKVEEDDTIESLEDKIHKEEHRLYPEVIRLFAKGMLDVYGRKVKVVNKKEGTKNVNKD